MWLAISFAAAPACAEAPLKVSLRTEAPAVGRRCELDVAAPAGGGNPYDPNEVALDAEIVSPSGSRTSLPGFHTVPHRRTVKPPPRRRARLIRIGMDLRNVPTGTVVEMLIDDIRLLDRDGRRSLVVDDFEGPLRWRAQHRNVTIEPRRADGSGVMHTKWMAAKPKGWPAIALPCGDADWEAFERISFRVKPLAGRQAMKKRPDMGPMFQLHVAPSTWLTQKLHTGGFEAGRWRRVVQALPRLYAEHRFAASGPPGWRVRFTPAEPGRHTVRVAFGRKGRRQARAELAVAVGGGQADGFVRVSPRDGRYLAFAGGRAFFPVGTNLVYWRDDLGYYDYYLARLAAAKCNTVRTWLSPGCLGFERALGRYDPRRAAMFDAFLELCRRRGLRVIVCVSDFREVSRKHGTWERSIYNAANGGPCRKPEEFFTDAAAGRLYRNRLRYAAARWGCQASIIAWELFNEVSLTEGWKKDKPAVRRWHAAMGRHLRGLLPSGSPITTSLAGERDDEIWAQANMDIAQRHLYVDPRESVALMAAEGVGLLGRHGKPVLIGEFGRSGNEYAQQDTAGVSLHNGLWASTLGGSCGAAMSWYWQWIDDHGLWKHLARLRQFVDGIDWPGEGFSALVSPRVTAAADPAGRMLAVRVIPVRGRWKPHPVNQPVTTALREDNTIDKPERVSKLLHGSFKEKLLNPVTFRVGYVSAGRFVVHVDEVARAGGELVVSVDGAVRLRKAFADLRPPEERGKKPPEPEDQPDRADDEEEDKPPLPPRGGAFEVAVGPGPHEVRVANEGVDWLRVEAYEFMGTRSRPPARAAGLRGRRTVLVWLWNESHLWDRRVLDTPQIVLKDVSVVLEGIPPGAWRVRPFDPWAGRWGDEHPAAVGAAGRLTLSVAKLPRDAAWRIEKQGAPAETRPGAAR